MSNFTQRTYGTDFDYKVGDLTQALVDDGYTEISVTKVDDGWEIVGKKPTNTDE